MLDVDAETIQAHHEWKQIGTGESFLLKTKAPAGRSTTSPRTWKCENQRCACITVTIQSEFANNNIQNTVFFIQLSMYKDLHDEIQLTKISKPAIRDPDMQT